MRSPRKIMRRSLALISAVFFATILAVPAPSQTFSVLHSFKGSPDGSGPEDRPVLDPKGNVYVGTWGGGVYGFGSVVRLTPAGDETVIHSFGNIPDGNYPRANLLLDKSGDVYGTTNGGGSASSCGGYGCGAVFKLSKSGRKLWLTSFLGGSDGATPEFGSMVMDSAGNIYGTTSQGGGTNCPSFVGCGTVFKVDPSGVESVFYRFTGVPDGATPYGGLVIDGSGNLYGTTVFGGEFDFGTVFKVTPDGEEKVLYSFSSTPDGAEPVGDMAIDNQGNLFGTTTAGGTTICGNIGCGTIFEVDANGNESILYSFTGGRDGFSPGSGVIRDKQGNLFGTTEGGSYGNGVVFAYVRGTFRVLYTFTGGTDGGTPNGLARDLSGNLYGTGNLGGVYGCCGVVFKIDPYKN
jgi:uncharacterized repeat protein (TIGR03803 family)